MDWNKIVYTSNLTALQSLPLYEGVDWNVTCASSIIGYAPSPSLRGSGLKYKNLIWQKTQTGLPLYEGVDWNPCRRIEERAGEKCLPLYEGVDWNSNCAVSSFCDSGLPLYEGVDWNNDVKMNAENSKSLPLYEGVDWNGRNSKRFSGCKPSPSLRGSGLKFNCGGFFQKSLDVSLFTREWIEISICWSGRERRLQSPSLRGSGLKWGNPNQSRSNSAVSLFTREWIEISSGIAGYDDIWCLPLYEGVDWNPCKIANKVVK